MNAFGSATTQLPLPASHFPGPPLHHLPVLARHHHEEMLECAIPLAELTLGAGTTGRAGVLLDESAQEIALAEIGDVNEIDERLVAALVELAELVEHECQAAAHSGAEVATDPAEHHHGSTRHVLAAVVADAFHHRHRAAVANGEPLTSDAGDVRLARCRAIQGGIPDQHRLIGYELRRLRVPNDQTPARQTLADVVVGFALQLERESARGKGAKALARRAGELE